MVRAVCSPSKIQSLKAIHNATNVTYHLPICCLQSVKDTKFESNSQLHHRQYNLSNAVCSPSKIQSLKAIHNSPGQCNNLSRAVCSPSKIQSLKAIHNCGRRDSPCFRSCLQSVKDTKFESNSQLRQRILRVQRAVCSPSKIQSLKAIHNRRPANNTCPVAVCSPSKIQSLKAIHNRRSIASFALVLFAVRQRYKV